MKNINSTKKKIIVVLAITFIATAIVAAIVFTKPQMYTVHSSFIIHNMPIRTTMDINKYSVAAIKDKDIADAVSSANNITVGDFRSRVTASIDANKSIGMAVSAETPETAAKMSEQIVELLNAKILGVVADQIQLEASEAAEALKAKSLQIDSLKHVIEEIDSIVSAEVSKTGSRKDQLIEHKILLEKNPDYIFANKLMEKFATDYGTALAKYSDGKGIIDCNKNFVTVIKKANPDNASSSTNKTKSLAIIAFLAFVGAICIVTFWNMIALKCNKTQADEK